MTSVSASSKLVEMEQPKLSDSVIESTIERACDWDIISTIFLILEVKDAALLRCFEFTNSEHRFHGSERWSLTGKLSLSCARPAADR